MDSEWVIALSLCLGIISVDASDNFGGGCQSGRLPLLLLLADGITVACSFFVSKAEGDGIIVSFRHGDALV